MSDRNGNGIVEVNGPAVSFPIPPDSDEPLNLTLPTSARPARKRPAPARPPLAIDANHYRRTERRLKVRRLPPARTVALAVATVGIAVLALSVVHCTEAISLLTGSHWALSALLAVGIDAGMVCAEAGAMLAADRKTGRRAYMWAQTYIAVAVLLSMLLNCYAFQLHAAEGMRWAALTLGAVLPGLVYILGRVSGELWKEGK